ncbi:MAG: MATE family efflux transporter [Caldicoprobacterales bacterium]|jgi:putative MATE family efflux protein|nr:MATE family efflux transporter [Clostridiales bacterium]
MLNDLFEDRKFYQTLLKLAIPIAAQNFVASTVNMVDTVMIGQLGETEIAAVGQANQLFFLFALMLFGVISGSAIYTAQYWGVRDIKNIRRVQGLALISACAVAGVFTLIALFFPMQAMRVYSKDPVVVDTGVRYLRIVGLSYIFTAVSFSYASILRSTEQPKLPMFISIISLIANAVLNYILIFGKLGSPALGVEGAALATLIARVVETALMLIIVYTGKYVPAARIRELLDVSREFTVRFFRTAVPVILNESIWALGVSIYSIVYGRIGTSAVAAVNISGTVTNLAMVLFQGMSNAAGVMIGNRIGAGEEEHAYIYAKRLLALGPALAVLMGCLLALSSGFFAGFYNVPQEVQLYAVRLLIAFSLLMPFKMFNLINIVGVLRSGGDTRYSLFLDTAGVWGIGIPLALAGGLLLQLPVYWVYFLAGLEEVFKLVLGLRRFRSRKWINNLIHNEN